MFDGRTSDSSILAAYRGGLVVPFFREWLVCVRLVCRSGRIREQLDRICSAKGAGDSDSVASDFTISQNQDTFSAPRGNLIASSNHSADLQFNVKRQAGRYSGIVNHDSMKSLQAGFLKFGALYFKDFLLSRPDGRKRGMQLCR